MTVRELTSDAMVEDLKWYQHYSYLLNKPDIFEILFPGRTEDKIAVFCGIPDLYEDLSEFAET